MQKHCSINSYDNYDSLQLQTEVMSSSEYVSLSFCEQLILFQCNGNVQSDSFPDLMVPRFT